MKLAVPVITGFTVERLTAPLIQPFRIATGSHPHLDNVIFSIEVNGRPAGLGEAAVATHITGETVQQTIKNLNSVGPQLVGQRADAIIALSRQLNDALPKNPCAVAAGEMALLDAWARVCGVPLYKFFGGAGRRLVTDITIVLADLQETSDAVHRFYRQGFRQFKVKVGKNQDLDFERLLAVKKIASRCPIYLDANQAYSADAMLKFLRRLKKAGITPALIEQPVPRQDIEGLKKITRAVRIPVCADESVRTPADARRLIARRAVSAVNIKLMKSGFFRGREIAVLARKAGLPLMMGAMMESPLAILAGAHFCAGFGGFRFIDLDTAYFLKKQPGLQRVIKPGGKIDLGPVKAGIGVRRETLTALAT
jgi:L-alanine-DL-glutamate epimerase-like enolase superfamily enzyme